jgi:uncharacterized membrane protein
MTRYTVTPIPTPDPAAIHLVFTLNDHGDVAGAEWMGGGAYHGFLWRNGTVAPATAAGTTSIVYGSNGAGVAVGLTPANGYPHAVMFRDGQVLPLKTLGGEYSEALAINEAGVIVGQSETADGRFVATMWIDGEPRELGWPGLATAVNASGDATGYSSSGEAWLWHAGTATRLPQIFQDDQPVEINASGQIVGYAGSGATALVLWENGGVRSLGQSLRFYFSRVGINDAGQIVADLNVNNFSVTPSLVQQGVTYGLQSLLVTQGYFLSAAIDINNKGEILCLATTNTNLQPVPVLLRPVS